MLVAFRRTRDHCFMIQMISRLGSRGLYEHQFSFCSSSFPLSPAPPPLLVLLPYFPPPPPFSSPFPSLLFLSSLPLLLLFLSASLSVPPPFGVIVQWNCKLPDGDKIFHGPGQKSFSAHNVMRSFMMAKLITTIIIHEEAKSCIASIAFLRS